MINDEAEEVVKELFDSRKNRYQNSLVETNQNSQSSLIKGSKFSIIVL